MKSYVVLYLILRMIQEGCKSQKGREALGSFFHAFVQRLYKAEGRRVYSLCNAELSNKLSPSEAGSNKLFFFPKK